MLVTVVRSGEAPPDGRFFKIRELANSKLFLMNIHQDSIQVLVKKWFSPKVDKKFQRIAQIEAVA